MKLPEEQNASGSTIDEPDQDLSFVDVEFGYGEADVLRRVSCRIPKGQVTAVIGSNHLDKLVLAYGPLTAVADVLPDGTLHQRAALGHHGEGLPPGAPR